MSSIVPIVEGPGDVEAVPLLLRKVLGERYQRYDVQVPTPWKTSGRGGLIRKLEQHLQYATIENPDCRAILVLLDADNDTDCPKFLAPELARRSKEVFSNISVAIVCARREYEAWFLASLDTLKGKPIKGRPGLLDSAAFSGSVEDLRGVKEWLTQHMPQGRAYKETLDQATLTSYIDLNLAHGRSRSFRRLCHAVQELVQAMDTRSVIISPCTEATT